ncbi:MAG: glycosyltransferase family 39 protein [Pseudomonadota bacterium]
MDAIAEKRFASALILVSATFVLFVGSTVEELHATSVFYAALAREMLEAGSFASIFLDERAYLLKPPLTFVTAALSMELFGINGFAATLGTRLSGIAIVLLTYAITARALSPLHGVIAAFVVLSNSTFIQFTTTIRTDAMMSVGMLLVVLGWLNLPKRWANCSLFIGLSFGLLAKGPAALLILPVLIAHRLLVRERKFIEIRAWTAIFLLPPLCWYGILIVQHGWQPLLELTSDFSRASSNPGLSFWNSVALEYFEKPLRRYWPWLPFMIMGAVVSLIGRQRRHQENRIGQWLAAWVGIMLLVGIVKPDHDIRYLYPALPALGGLAALGLMHLFPRLPLLPTSGVLAVVVIGFALSYGINNRHDINREIVCFEEHASSIKALAAVDAMAISLTQPRRQNTHRDWSYFYLGIESRNYTFAEFHRADPYQYLLIGQGSRGRAFLEDSPYTVICETKKMKLARRRVP